ncbi:hypothetical protein AWB67_06890 [Caballeronia terrestris]|uniref:Uncharacterized protein n=2 Tax=Caballeronia terrestris TaxID=1226301 RepID=A0A158KXA3_9BURK|nr:hypothetical protein AWB67_06890 [Caballeronia terrestris]
MCIGAPWSVRCVESRKKNASDFPARITSDPDALVEGYEALRIDMVEKRGCCPSGRGRTLLMRKGMAAWMAGMREIAPCTPTARVTTHDTGPSAGIRQDLIDILTSMVLANALEETA